MTLTDDVSFWLDSYADTTELLASVAVQQAVERWLGFDQWYDAAAVATLAAELALVSAAAQQQSAGAAAAYVGAVAGVLGAPSLAVPSLPFGTIRNGAPGRVVHTRPAEAYKRAIATGSTHQEALERAGLRARGVMASDLTLQQRDAEQRVLERVGVTAYRRIIRPEMSRSGSCGLCIAAATRVYSTGELMPLHPPSCNCTVMPIIGEEGGAGDPGLVLNETDLLSVLAEVYGDADGTKAADLRRTQYAVNQHGEYGPVLTRFGDAFRGPDRVALEDDPARAARLLAKAAPVLTLMQGGGSDVPDQAAALKYQRELVERLESIVAA